MVAATAKFAKLRENQLPEGGTPSPAPVGTSLFDRTQTSRYRLGESSSDPDWCWRPNPGAICRCQYFTSGPPLPKLGEMFSRKVCHWLSHPWWQSSLSGRPIVVPVILGVAVATVLKAAPLVPLPAGQTAAVERHLAPLTPAEELKTIQLPNGYRLELVLSEPDIREPMGIAFDGNGRMYVIEMRTYMQDIEGAGELEPKSRVSRHESSRGDGVFDRHSVYADNLLIPRMVLPLQDEVLIGVTDTNDIRAWQDRNGDGVADGSRLFYEGGPRGGNLEHQPSGLVWALDNWIYTTYNAYRLRWSPDGKTLKEPTAPNGGQWGLTQDDWGKPWFSNAGGEQGVWNFQTHIAYGAVNVPNQWPEGWMTVWPAVGLGDVQGGPGRLRPDGTLNHFTASCGQEIFRGDRLPAEVRGDVFLPEPVGRLIRRGKVEMRDGVTHLENPYPQSEFIRSTDANFRPVNLATGPDGCLYVVDTYRGIIQEGNWTKSDSFLRPQIQRWGLDKNVGRGRIWRLTHRDFKPGPAPNMLTETSAQLVDHLPHPNGWWRDTAQRLLVVRQDQSVVPSLTRMATEHPNPLARVHALWTLEGLASVDAALVRRALKDASPRVRENVIRLAETLVKAGDAPLAADVLAMAQDTDPNVVLQAIGTAKRMNLPNWPKWSEGVIAAASSDGVRQIGKALTTTRPVNVKSFSPAELAVLKRGEAIYRELCFACHGMDGKGMTQQGAAPGATLGPPLAGSRTLLGPAEGTTLIVLHGLAGPVNGKTYEAQMVPMESNADEWVASIVSYIRNSFGNRGSFVPTNQVRELRQAFPQRIEPWTELEVRHLVPESLTNRRSWKLTASGSTNSCPAVVDGKADTRWDTGASQTPGQWFQVELPETTSLAGVRLETMASPDDYPRGYRVELSPDGIYWGEAVAVGRGNGAVTEIPFRASPGRFLRITQTGAVSGLFWSIHELQVWRAH